MQVQILQNLGETSEPENKIDLAAAAQAAVLGDMENSLSALGLPGKAFSTLYDSIFGDSDDVMNELQKISDQITALQNTVDRDFKLAYA